MTSSTKTTQYSIKEIKTLIDQGKWKKLMDFDNRYFGSNSSGEWTLEKKDQHRAFEYDEDHVDYIRSVFDINELDAKVAVMFNTETYDTDEETGEEYLVARKGDMLLVGGTHTWYVEVNEGVNISPKGINIVDFEQDLNGSLSKLKAFGTAINNHKKVAKPYDKSDVKNVVYQYMDENKKFYGVPKLTPENYNEILELFPIVSRETIKLWVSHHPTAGGRRKPPKKYTKKKKELILETLENLHGNTHEILEIRELRAWNGTGVSTMCSLAYQMDKKMIPNKPAFYVTFYCSSVKQVEDLPSDKKKIKAHYKWLEKKLGRTIEVYYLPHK